MKHQIRIALSLAVLFAVAELSYVGMFSGCQPGAQQTAYNTIFSLQQTVGASYSAYLGLVVKGQASTNSLPKIAKAFNDFQAASQLAMDGVQYNTNALAPPSLVTEGQDLLNLINTAK